MQWLKEMKGWHGEEGVAGAGGVANVIGAWGVFFNVSLLISLIGGLFVAC
mgnify:CR=1 FL=1